MAAKHLTGAIVAYLKGSMPWAAAMVGGIRDSEAPRDTPFPYLVIQKADSSTLPIFGGRFIDTRTYVFSLYHSDRVAVEDLGNQLRDLIVGTEGSAPPPKLTFQEGLDVSRLPAGGDSIEIDEERGPLDVDVYAYRFPVAWTVSR